MKAFLYVGGEIFPENISERPEDGDLVIAADSGYENAKRLSAHVDLFVGDMDSYDGEIDGDVEIVRLKPEKDVTDTHAAFELAVQRGAREIYIVGGLSGRLDHTLSNLAILEDARARGIRAQINDGYNRVRFIKNDSILIGRCGFRYFGLIAADEKVRGVEIQGAKYPLKNAKIERTFQYAVSNEIVGNCALIAIKKGKAFIVESDERL